MFQSIRNQSMVEKENRRLLRKDGMIALSVIFFFCSYGMILPYDMEGSTDGIGVEWLFYLFFAIAFDILNDAMTFTIQYDKKINIFSRMIHTPVDYKLFLGGKLYLLWKELLLAELIYQIPALFIRIMAGGSLLTPVAFSASFMILLTGILESAKIILAYTFRNKSDF